MENNTQVSSSENSKSHSTSVASDCQKAKLVELIQDQLPSWGFNNPLNPFPDDTGNGKWAQAMAENIHYALLSAGALVQEKLSPHDRQKLAERIARYFAGYSFSRHEAAQCLGLVDVLIAEGVISHNPGAETLLDYGSLAAHMACVLGALEGYGHKETAAYHSAKRVQDELMRAYTQTTSINGDNHEQR